MQKQDDVTVQAAASHTQLIRIQEVMRRTGLKGVAIEKRMREGTFPKGIKLGINPNTGEHRLAWVASEVEKWVNDTIAASRAT